MNSRRSLDNGRIGILGHDQLQEDLQFFVAGKGAAIFVVGIVRFIKREEFPHDFFRNLPPKQQER